MLYFVFQYTSGLTTDTVLTNFLGKIIAIGEHEAEERIRVVGVELTEGVKFHTGDLRSKSCIKDWIIFKTPTFLLPGNRGGSERLSGIGKFPHIDPQRYTAWNHTWLRLS